MASASFFWAWSFYLFDWLFCEHSGDDCARHIFLLFILFLIYIVLRRRIWHWHYEERREGNGVLVSVRADTDGVGKGVGCPVAYVTG